MSASRSTTPAGATIGHTVTDANGLYLFDRLNAGTYHVCFDVATIPAGYEITTENAPGSTRANGSDAGTDGCAVSDGARAGPARPRLGRRHLEDAAHADRRRDAELAEHAAARRQAAGSR